MHRKTDWGIKDTNGRRSLLTGNFNKQGSDTTLPRVHQKEESPLISQMGMQDTAELATHEGITRSTHHFPIRPKVHRATGYARDASAMAHVLFSFWAHIVWWEFHYTGGRAIGAN